MERGADGGCRHITERLHVDNGHGSCKVGLFRCTIGDYHHVVKFRGLGFEHDINLRASVHRFKQGFETETTELDEAFGGDTELVLSVNVGGSTLGLGLFIKHIDSRQRIAVAVLHRSADRHFLGKGGSGCGKDEESQNKYPFHIFLFH